MDEARSMSGSNARRLGSAHHRETVKLVGSNEVAGARYMPVGGVRMRGRSASSRWGAGLDRFRLPGPEVSELALDGVAADWQRAVSRAGGLK
jgi:hypothetical protein